MQAIDAHPGEEKLAELVENRVREEIRRGVQTIQYQVVTLLTTNGQAVRDGVHVSRRGEKRAGAP